MKSSDCADANKNGGIERLIAEADGLGFHAAASIWQKDFGARAEKPRVRIAFIGEFNHGKSAIINALCGRNIVPSGMTPTTQTETDIAFDAEADGVTAWTSGSAEPAARWTLDDWMRKAVKLTAGAMQKAAISRISIELRGKGPISDCIFADTPGLNETSLLRESGIDQILMRADIVVFVLDANQALTRTEMNFLSILAQKVESDRRILVINKCDFLAPDDRLGVCRHVESAVAPILGDGLFWMISARNPGAGDWDAFAEDLTQKASAMRATVLSDAAHRIEAALEPAARAMRAVADYIRSLSEADCAQILKQYADPFAASPKDLADFIAEIGIRAEQMQTETQNEIDRYEQDFLRAIGRELDKSPIADIASCIEDFIDDSFSEFAASQIDARTGGIEKLCADAWRIFGGCGELPGDIAETAAEREAIFESVSHNIRYSSPTGAFDETRLRIAGILFKPNLAGRLERPMRDTLCKMAQKAISCRSRSFKLAFCEDFARFRETLCAAARELGSAWRTHIGQVIASRKNDRLRPT